ncbi:hypothetical protein V6N13_018862 [Hibiscus sabdariffa]|uniref:Uncharacterized protein n=1 Tax=Hibiscus sabdariffa TaxID=183260 RepID=A0ABR2EKN8_9ROSI
MAVAKLLFLSLVLAQVFLLSLPHLAVADEKPDVAAPPVIPREAEEPAATPSNEAEPPEIRRLGKHHAPDGSVAGGDVIVGGLATAVLVVVFAYIRVTRKNKGVQVQQH